MRGWGVTREVGGTRVPSLEEPGDRAVEAGETERGGRRTSGLLEAGRAADGLTETEKAREVSLREEVLRQGEALHQDEAHLLGEALHLGTVAAPGG